MQLKRKHLLQLLKVDHRFLRRHRVLLDARISIKTLLCFNNDLAVKLRCKVFLEKQSLFLEYQNVQNTLKAKKRVLSIIKRQCDLYKNQVRLLNDQSTELRAKTTRKTSALKSLPVGAFNATQRLQLAMEKRLFKQ
jgi:hypothetical protein